MLNEDERTITFTPIQVESTIPVVSDEQLEQALVIARASGIIEDISGNQEWSYDRISAAGIDGAEAVRFNAK